MTGRRPAAPRSPQSREGIEQLAPVADGGNAQFPQILGAQQRQDLGIDAMRREGLDILSEAEARQPSRNVQSRLQPTVRGN